jgi:hypothetical protein
MITICVVVYLIVFALIGVLYKETNTSGSSLVTAWLPPVLASPQPYSIIATNFPLTLPAFIQVNPLGTSARPPISSYSSGKILPSFIHWSKLPHNHPFTPKPLGEGCPVIPFPNISPENTDFVTTFSGSSPVYLIAVARCPRPVKHWTILPTVWPLRRCHEVVDQTHGSLKRYLGRCRPAPDPPPWLWSPV